jgi:hypothetical protein
MYGSIVVNATGSCTLCILHCGTKFNLSSRNSCCVFFTASSSDSVSLRVSGLLLDQPRGASDGQYYPAVPFIRQGAGSEQAANLGIAPRSLIFRGGDNTFTSASVERWCAVSRVASLISATEIVQTGCHVNPVLVSTYRTWLTATFFRCKSTSGIFTTSRNMPRCERTATKLPPCFDLTQSLS